MIEGYEDITADIKAFIPNYKYLLYDLSEYSDEDIKGIAQLRIILTIFRDIFIKNKDGIKKTIILAGEYLRELEDKETGIEYFESVLRYVFSAGKSFDEKDIIEIIKEAEKVLPAGSGLITTTAERLRQEGLKEGLEEGLKKGLLKNSIRLLTKKFGLLPNDIVEVLNYAEALTEAQDLLKRIPISTRMFFKLHETILKDSRGENRGPGSYRKIQNYIGPTSRIEDATYIPPEPNLVEGYMSNLEKYINDEYEDDFGFISRTAIIHGQFETIHPFLDGNGRLGRILIIIYLLDKGIISFPSFFVSEELKKNKYKYYILLNGLRLEKPRWKEWIVFFLNSSIKQADKHIEKLLTIESLYDELLLIAKQKAISDAAISFIFNKPIFTIKKMQEEIGVSYNTASRYVAELTDSGKIYGDDKKRNRVYSFYDLINVL